MSLELRSVPRASCYPSPLNPRQAFHEERLAELAESLREQGVLEPLVVRPADTEPWRIEPGKSSGTPGFFLFDMRRYRGPGEAYDGVLPFFATREEAEAAIPRYEIIAGHRRWRAAELAGLEELPAIVRDLSDEQALLMMMTENLQRADLSALEAARGYARLAEMGLTKQAIADSLGLARPTVSNALRLLELPPSVQAMIDAGQLSAGHGKALLKWSGYPEFMAGAAELAVSQHWSTHQLESDSLPSSYEVEQRGLVAHAYRSIVQEHCHACPHGAFRANGTGGYCFEPDCHAALVKAQEADTERKAAEQVEQARQKGAKWAQQQEAPAAGEQDGASAGLPALSSLPYGTYQVVEESSLPEGCKGRECEHLGYGTQAKHIVAVCFKPKCYNKLKQAPIEAAKTARAERIEATAEAARAVVNGDWEPWEMGRKNVAVVVAAALERAEPNDLRTALAALGLELPPEVFGARYDAPVTAAEALDILAGMDIMQQLRLAALTILAKERRQAATSTYDHADSAHWLASQESELPFGEWAQRHHYRREAIDAVRARAGLPPLPAGPEEGAMA